jgi:hypothetical protein
MLNNIRIFFFILLYFLLIIFTFVLRDDPPIVWAGIIECDDVCGDKGETGVGNANSTVGG